ncbi:MAG: GTP cyclohydrolase II [Pseudomonadota bacterium]
MSLTLTVEERASRARADLRVGAPIALIGATGGALVLAAETASDTRLADLRALVPDAFDLAISNRRAETLRARVYDGTLARVVMSETADAAWVLATADPARDMDTPLKGPYRTRRDGSAELHALAIQLAKQAHTLPAAVLAVWDDATVAERIATEAGLSILTTAEAMEAAEAAIRLRRVSAARVPTRFSEVGRVHVFRPDDGAEEHYAVEVGSPSRSAPVLARLHSACFTGDVMGSLKCDCGPQLAAAMTQIADAGAGVLLYMNQEGRGIGLANKMRAYALQDQGFDTVQANHRLGFEDDERDFRLGAEILKAMGIHAVRLMTNNPAKVAMMEASGVDVAERVPLRVGETKFNEGYLATKAAKSGHLL